MKSEKEIRVMLKKLDEQNIKESQLGPYNEECDRLNGCEQALLWVLGENEHVNIVNNTNIKNNKEVV